RVGHFVRLLVWRTLAVRLAPREANCPGDIRPPLLYPVGLPLSVLCCMYNCARCPGFCCSYEIIPLTKRDVERLAKHFDLSLRDAKKKFTVPRDDAQHTMQRKPYPHFG